MHLIISIAKRKLLINKFQRFDLQLTQRTHYNCSKKIYKIILEFLLLEKIELIILKLNYYAFDVNCCKIRVYIK